MNTDIDHALSHQRPDEDDDVAVARGYLATALDRCDPDHIVALEICGVWSSLDEPGRLPHQVHREVPLGISVLGCLTLAYESLRTAAHDVEPAVSAVRIAIVSRELWHLILAIRDDSTAPGRGLS